MARGARRRFILGGIGAVLIAGLAGAVGIASTQGRAESTPPAPTPVATEAPARPFPAATPPAAASTLPPAVEEPLAMPFGPISAEPYRVRTGDGDCLNVRPVPGTTFKSDPRACVPEGFLLWLYGEAREVDGHTWRYALGEGWVATQYVVAAPGAESGFGSFSAVTVAAPAGEVTKLAKVSKDGTVVQLPTLPDAMTTLGDTAPALSPDGNWAAYGGNVGYVPTLTIRNMTTGLETRYPQANAGSWGPNNRLLVRVNTDCPNQCTWTVGWLDPREGVIYQLTDQRNEWWNTAWALDGESLFVVERGALKQVWLDGRQREIVGASAEVPWGQLSLSEDGRQLISSPYQGAIVVIDVQSGAVSRVERAKQIPVGGKCGGSVGSLTSWLDASTVIWHESYAEKGGNGITISRIDGTGRRLIPFFTVSDIRRVAPGLVSFTTWEDPNNGRAFQVSWLLDAPTGEARPVTVGASPAWE